MEPWNAARIKARNDDKLIPNDANNAAETSSKHDSIMPAPELQFEWYHVQLSSHPRCGGAVESGPTDSKHAKLLGMIYACSAVHKV